MCAQGKIIKERLQTKMADIKERKKKKNLINKKVINETELSGVQKNLSLSNKKMGSFPFFSDDFLKEMLFRHMMFLLFHMPYDMG